jgi:hypothetical protein
VNRWAIFRYPCGTGTLPRIRRRVRQSVAVLVIAAVGILASALFTGCESEDGGGASVSGGVYYGVGFYDPWYYGGYYDDPDIIVTPPDRPDRPDTTPRPEHPIVKPPVSTPSPRPMPSIPSMPRASARR